MNKDKQSIIPEIDSDKVVIVGQNEKHFREVKWQIKPHPGHTVFEINLENGDVKAAEYEEVNMQVNDFGPQVNIHLQAAVIGTVIPAKEIKKKLITKQNCIYISALNIQNAAKKFAKRAKEGGYIK